MLREGAVPEGKTGERGPTENILHPVLGLRKESAKCTATHVSAISVRFEAALEGDRPLDGLHDFQDGDVVR
jgi:hypothetical protein